PHVGQGGFEKVGLWYTDARPHRLITSPPRVAARGFALCRRGGHADRPPTGSRRQPPGSAWPPFSIHSATAFGWKRTCLPSRTVGSSPSRASSYTRASLTFKAPATSRAVSSLGNACMRSTSSGKLAFTYLKGRVGGNCTLRGQNLWVLQVTARAGFAGEDVGRPLLDGLPLVVGLPALQPREHDPCGLA